MNAGIHDRPSCTPIAVAIAVLATVCFVAFSPGAAGAAAPASRPINFAKLQLLTDTHSSH